SGASSGIGAALNRAVPFQSARVINISRRPVDGCIHFYADLSDPASWATVAELFERETKGFGGERVVFIHSAGTLEPIGFAGEVCPDSYTRQVLLNSASPQVLGEAFVRASHATEALCQMLIIGSGAAANLYPGWSAYGPGKAAANQWVRTVGAEQHSRGGNCQVVSIAPGIVATPMQEQIRTVSAHEFPDVVDFIGYCERGELSDPDAVAVELWGLLRGDELENGSVLDLRDQADTES
ncbi:MAG: SDR family NAD(P)-dependent oxidoreductase, partial [Myxococcota bacterium]